MAPQPITSSWQVYKRLLKYVRPYLWIFAVGVLANTLFAAIDSQLIRALEPVVDEGFVNKDPTFLAKLPYYIVFFILLRTVFGFVSDYCMGLVGRNVIQDLRQALFDKYLLMPARFFDERQTGQLISTISYNTDRVGTAATEAIKDVAREGATLLFLIGVVFYNSWELGTLFFIGGPLIGWVLRSASQRFKRISRGLQTAMGTVTQVSTQMVQGIRTIKMFGGQQQESTAFNQASESNKRYLLKMLVTKSLSQNLVYLIAGIALAGVFWVSANLLTSGKLTAGAFVASVAAMLAIQKPLKVLSQVNSVLAQGITAAQSVFEMLDLPNEDDRGTQAITRAKGHLRFEQVRFAYPGKNHDVLKEVSFDVPVGKTVALVGRSGSGKTTLATLLMRFYQPTAGEIRLDDVPIADIPLAQYRQQFALVSQQVTLFNDSVRANIAYGDTAGASDDAIIAAAKLANAWEFIQGLPNGLDTRVGDNGVNLSGGQRQRIAIARALLKDAPVLVLDEATSALDNESERLIQYALEKLMKNRTTIVIAHRLSTIENADSILVLEQGRIVEQGNHRELIARGGEYAKLHAMQFRDGGEA